MIKNLLGDDENPANDSAELSRQRISSRPTVLGLYDSGLKDDGETEEKENFVISTAEPDSLEETVRRNSLAWSAGIVFFASIAFMLILGWGADLLLGSSPWGVVGGLVLGSLIGFIQFFRLTSQIFKK